jgi:hypothetical protein
VLVVSPAVVGAGWLNIGVVNGGEEFPEVAALEGVSVCVSRAVVVVVSVVVAAVVVTTAVVVPFAFEVCLLANSIKLCATSAFS